MVTAIFLTPMVLPIAYFWIERKKSPAKEA